MIADRMSYAMSYVESVSYMHWGNFTEGIDERGEVALLTRNILIEGIMGDVCQVMPTNPQDYQQKCSLDFMISEITTTSEGQYSVKYKNQVDQAFQDPTKDIFGGHIRVSKDVNL